MVDERQIVIFLPLGLGLPPESATAVLWLCAPNHIYTGGDNSEGSGEGDDWLSPAPKSEPLLSPTSVLQIALGA